MTVRTAPFIITFASPKGGVGKSTNCLSVAAALAARNYPVHIMDLDQTRTLWRWYSTHKPNISNLSVESAVEQNFGEHLRATYHAREGFILIDAAGALTDIMVHAATIAHLTITPAKLSEPDIQEAVKLHYKLLEIGATVGKGITHRILVNEVAPLLPTYQRYTLDQINTGPLKRFSTLVHVRAPYAEAFLTGQPPHFADQSRPPVQKAVAEIDALLGEVFEALATSQQKAAA
jgi:chromosome partitioning protein